MEERILDDEEARLVKIKRTKNGDDVVEDTQENAAEEGDAQEGENEFTVEYPDDEEYDEDLVGLTPTQLQEELERREKAKREAQLERDAHVENGKALLEAGDFAGAEEEFAAAVSYFADDEEALKLLWAARTHRYTDTQAYYNEENARELHGATAQLREEVLSHDGEKLRAERETLRAEIRPLEKSVKEKQEERREPLRANREYYRLRLMILGVCLLCFAIAAGVSAYYTVRTTSIAPVVTAIVFGAGAVISLIFSVIYTRFWLVAASLYNANEKLSSTEDGKTLLSLQKKETCLSLILEEEERADDAE